MNSLKTQVGGTHYKDMKVQPYEYILANKLPFAEGNVVKLVSRWRSKNGIEDLRKAQQHLAILIEHEEGLAGTIPSVGSGLRIVLDGPPGPESGRFVEVEDEDGKSVNLGKWEQRTDGLWELGIQGETVGQLAIRLTSPSAPPKECPTSDACQGFKALPAPPEAILPVVPAPANYITCHPALDGLPDTFQPRVLAMPASKTDANGNTNLVRGFHAYAGDGILIHLDGAWAWRTVRNVICTMDGRKYNVGTFEGQSSILLVPHNHVFAIRTQGNVVIV